MTVIHLPKNHKSLAGCKPGDCINMKATMMQDSESAGEDDGDEGPKEGMVRAKVTHIEKGKQAKPAMKKGNPMEYLKSKNTGKLAQVSYS